jgi:O-methyltransferase involved in polyketide biosynthesis
VPPTLSFVALNLARENLAPALLAAGLEPDQPAFFAWLGVTPYLDAGTVWKTLRGVADLSGPTGGIVFDYAVPAERLGLVERVLAAGLAARVSAVGEPFRSYLRPEELATGLRALGFGSCEDLDAEMLNTRYFSRRADGLRVGGAAHIMVARSVRPSQIH